MKENTTKRKSGEHAAQAFGASASAKAEKIFAGGSRTVAGFSGRTGGAQ
jgi:hypothetical protein